MVLTALEDLTTPFDASEYAAIGVVLAAVTATGLATFTGPAMAVVVETDEIEPADAATRKARVMNARPVCDGGQPLVAIGGRERATDPVRYGPDVAMTTRGDCWQRVEARRLRARLTMPAAADFQHLIGIDLDIQAGGR